MSAVLEYEKEGNRYKTFVFIFKNNIKGCIFNIIGGFVLGIATIMNLVLNGFFSADIFASSYSAGMPLYRILETTLPHSFELLGFWLLGATGLYIAWNVILFIRGKESFSSHFYKRVGIEFIVVFVIILTAAYVEAYISMKM